MEEIRGKRENRYKQGDKNEEKWKRKGRNEHGGDER